MKNTLILIPFFLLLYLLVFFVLSAFNFFAFWVVNYSSNPSVTKAIVIANIPRIIYRAAPISTFFTLLLVSFRVLMKPGKRFLTLLVLLMVSSSVFFASVYLTASFYKISTPDSVNFADRVFAERLNPVGRYTVYPFAVSGRNMGNLVVCNLSNPGTSGKIITYYNSAIIVEKEDKISLLDGNRPDNRHKILTVDKSELGGLNYIFKGESFINFFLSDLMRMNRDISGAFHRDKKYFFVLSSSFIFLFVACGIFMRLTKWPLFNILLSLLVLRGVFYLYGFLKSDIASVVAGFLRIPGLKEYFPPYSLFLFGFLLFLIDFLFVPFDRWRREIEE